MGTPVVFDFVAAPGAFVTGANQCVTAMAKIEGEARKMSAVTKKAFADMGNSASADGGGAGAGGGGGLKGSLKNLKHQFGKGSTAGMAIKLIEGGGPILALGIAAKLFAEVGEGAEKLAEGVRNGSISMDELYPKLVEMIPIVGNLHKGFLGLWNAISPVGQDLRKQIDEQDALTKKIDEQLALETAGSEAERKRIQIEQKYAEQVKEVKKVEKEAAGEHDQNIAAHKVAAEQLAKLEKAKGAELEKVNADEEKAEREKNKWKTEAVNKAREAYELTLYGADAYELVKLAERGMNEEQLEAIRRWQEAKKALDAHNKSLEEAAQKQKQNQQAIQGTLRTLHDQVAELLMGKDAFEDFQLAERGASQAEREAAQHSRNFIEVQKIREENETANEKLAKEAARLVRLRDQLGEEQYKRAMDRARKNAADMKSYGGGELVGVEGLWSAIAASTGSAQYDANAAAANAIIAQAEQAAKADIDEQKKQTALLTKIAEKKEGLA